MQNVSRGGNLHEKLILFSGKNTKSAVFAQRDVKVKLPYLTYSDRQV